jgi:hypothetical protein
MGLHLVVARNEQHIADAERVRWKVYCEEERILPTSTGIDGRESDGYDFADATTHLLVYAGREPVGTVRLIAARARVAVSSRPLGLDLESNFELSGFNLPGIVLAEVTRYCVLRKFRGTRVTPALFAGLLLESKRRGVTHWVAAANMETDSAEDAAIAYRLIQARNLVSKSFCAHARSVVVPPLKAGRFVYTQEQRLNAQRGELGALRLPRTLALFATKMGARYIGAPSYDSRFNVFAAPLAVNLADIDDQRMTAGPARSPYHFSGISIGPRLELATPSDKSALP